MMVLVIPKRVALLDRAMVSALLGCVALMMPQVATAGPTPSRQELRETLKLLWDSLDSVSVRCDEWDLDESGQRDALQGFSRFDLLFASGGRRTFRLSTVRPEGDKTSESWSESWREDGRRTIGIIYDPGSQHKIKQVVIRNQVNTADNYQGVMCNLLWLLMPGGTPLYTRIDEGVTIGPVSGEAPKGLVPVIYPGQWGRPVRCELDPAHDWLPARIVMEGGDMDLQVDEFRLVDGRWFPVSGHNRSQFQGKSKTSAFAVDQVAINRPVPLSAFDLPELPAGILLIDKTRNQARVVGGASVKPSPAVATRIPDSRRSADPPVQASVELERTPWRGIIFGIAVLALAAAGFFALRYRKMSRHPGSRPV